MGTQSHITVEHEKDKFKTIYCHWDGYPSHVGKVLDNHYNTLSKAVELVSLGDMSSLDTTLETSEFYHRDRGEDIHIHECDDFDKVQDYIGGYYHYYFDFDKQQWLCDAGEGYQPIPEAIKTNED